MLCAMTWMCIRVCLHSFFSRVQLFVTPWTVVSQPPLSMGFSRQQYWSGWPCPPPGDLPDSRIETLSLISPALPVDCLSSEPPGKSLNEPNRLKFICWNPNPKHDDICWWSLEEMLKSWGNPHEWKQPLIRGPRVIPSHLLSCEDTVRSLWPSRGPSPDHGQASILISDFQPPKL